MSNVKQELEKIKIPKELHERTKLGVKKAKLEQQKRLYKNPLVAAAVISVIVVGSLLSPSVQAVIDDLFSYNQVKNIEDAYIGWMWGDTAGDNSKVYNSLDEIEDHFNINIPVPEEFLAQEVGSIVNEHRINTENGKFVTYKYDLRTKDRIFSFTATNVSKQNPTFTADTTKDMVVEKEVLINDVPATLIGIYDLNVYHIYLENNGWKIVISAIAEGVGEGYVAPELTEEEMVKIVESIKW